MSKRCSVESPPRVLVVNADCLEKESPTGLTLRSLFRDYPKSRLLQIYLNEMGIEPHSPRALSMKKAFPLSCLLRSRSACLKNEQIKETLRQGAMGSARVKQVKRRLRRDLIIAEDLGPMREGRIKWDELSGFSPDIVYTIGGSVRALRLASLCSQRFNVPLVVHFMDDWPSALKVRKGVNEAWYSKALLQALDKALERSRGGLGISPFMADAYGEMFGMPFSWAGCVVDDMFARGVPRYSDEFGKAVVYAGGLHLGRWKSLLEVENAISVYAPDYHLAIITSYDDRSEFEDAFGGTTLFYDPVPRKDLPDIYASAACLLYVEDIGDAYHEAYCRLSISTKLPECLVSGMPLLFYGPDSMGVYGLLKAQRLAAVASSKRELGEALLSALEGEIDVKVAAEYANCVFSASASTKRVVELFNQSITRWADENE